LVFQPLQALTLAKRPQPRTALPQPSGKFNKFPLQAKLDTDLCMNKADSSEIDLSAYPPFTGSVWVGYLKPPHLPYTAPNLLQYFEQTPSRFFSPARPWSLLMCPHTFGLVFSSRECTHFGEKAGSTGIKSFCLLMLQILETYP